MAKKSMIAKQRRTPKHPVQAYHRCTVCGIERRCRTSAGDDVDTMVEIVRERGRG